VAALTPDNVEAFRRLAVLLTGGRLAVAVVNSLGIVAVYLLARRLWPQEGSRFQVPGSRTERSAPGPWPLASIPYLAALLLALDPFLAGSVPCRRPERDVCHVGSAVAGRGLKKVPGSRFRFQGKTPSSGPYLEPGPPLLTPWPAVGADADPALRGDWAGTAGPWRDVDGLFLPCPRAWAGILSYGGAGCSGRRRDGIAYPAPGATCRAGNRRRQRQPPPTKRCAIFPSRGL
jgi:hypothetical protein